MEEIRSSFKGKVLITEYALDDLNRPGPGGGGFDPTEGFRYRGEGAKAKASIQCAFQKTPKKELAKLVPNLKGSALTKDLKANAYISVMFNPTVVTQDPEWTLEWAEFKVTLQETEAKLLAFAPDAKEIETKFIKAGKSGYSVSAGAELGPSLKRTSGKTTTTPDETSGTSSGTEAGVAAKVSASMSHNKEGTWSIEYPGKIPVIEGFRRADVAANSEEVGWRVYGNPLDSSVSGVRDTVTNFAASFAMKVKKGSAPSFPIALDGGVKGPRRVAFLPWKQTGTIELTSEKVLRLSDDR